MEIYLFFSVQLYIEEKCSEKLSKEKKNYSSRVYFTICTHCIYVYIYIYTRAFTCHNIPLTTLTFFEGRSRDTERNKTKQKRNTQKH